MCCGRENIQAVKDVIASNRDNIAFLLGNGINRFANIPECSWADILRQLWTSFLGEIPNVPENIAYTEFYDILEKEYLEKNFNLIRNNIPNHIDGDDNFMRGFYNTVQAENIFSMIQQKLCEMLRRWKPSEIHRRVVTNIKSFNAPILTTNFDKTLSDSLTLQYYHLPFPNDKLHWNYYYADTQLDIPCSGFGIWNIHGSIECPKTLRFGLSHYMEAVSEERSLFSGGTNSSIQNCGIPDASLNGHVDSSTWLGANTWLHIFYNKPIMVIGLELSEREVFLRWLFTQRALYYSMYKEHAVSSDSGWYITTAKDKEVNSFFFEHVGLKVFKVPSYADIYENILCNMI